MNVGFRRYMRAMDGVLFSVDPGTYMVLEHAFAATYLDGSRFARDEGEGCPYSQDLAVDLGIIFG